jgi:hypothetical protein
MATPTSGISLLAIQTEFGGVAPILLSEYYSGGAYVQNPAPTSTFQQPTPVPTSGPISMGSFLGLTRSFIYTDTISAHTVGVYDVRARAVAVGWNQSDRLTWITIVNSGVALYAPNTSQFAFTCQGSFPAGTEITLLNYGYIVGRGGSGGTGDTIGDAPTVGTPGSAGGPAMATPVGLRLYNYGIIGGGGGGGGGGGSSDAWNAGDGTLSRAAGSGGGGGASFGAAGGGGSFIDPSPYGSPYYGNAGGSGSIVGAGGGGPRITFGGGFGGAGGAGGYFGAAGAAGESGSAGLGSAGGAPGAAIANSGTNIVVVYGTILGALT